MPASDEDGATPLRQFALGALVLGLTVLLANVGSFHVRPGAAIEDRLADHLIARSYAIGNFAQIAAGVWLALTLILDIAWGRRWAPVLWLLALCLFLAPLPPLTADPALAPSLVVIGAGIAILGRRLLEGA